MTPIRRPRGERPRRPRTGRKPIRHKDRILKPRDRGIRDRMRRCPDPNMFILMADGSQKKAGDLKVGDLVKTYHEKDLEKASKKSLVLASGSAEKYSQLRDQLESSYAKATLGEYEVEFVDIIKDVEKIKLTFEGSEIVCSLSHKFYVNDSWKEAQDMVVGDEVSGKKLVLIEDVKDGDVVHITVKDAHTYICEGLLSHNKSIRDPRIKRPPLTEEGKERIRKRKEEKRRKVKRIKRRRRPVFRKLRKIMRRLRRRRRRRISDPRRRRRISDPRRGPVKTNADGGRRRGNTGRRRISTDKKKFTGRKDEVRIQPVEKDEVRIQPVKTNEGGGRRRSGGPSAGRRGPGVPMTKGRARAIQRRKDRNRRSALGRKSNRRVGGRRNSSRRGGSRRGGRR